MSRPRPPPLPSFLETDKLKKNRLVWDGKGERKAHKEERFPVISICPTTSDFEGQIKTLTCSGYGPNSFRSFTPQKQQIEIGTISSATELFDCFTVNEAQDYVGTNSSFFIKCDITFNEVVNQGQARITTWANHDVWPHAIIQEPIALFTLCVLFLVVLIWNRQLFLYDIST